MQTVCSAAAVPGRFLPTYLRRRWLGAFFSLSLSDVYGIGNIDTKIPSKKEGNTPHTDIPFFESINSSLASARSTHVHPRSGAS